MTRLTIRAAAVIASLLVAMTLPSAALAHDTTCLRFDGRTLICVQLRGREGITLPLTCGRLTSRGGGR